MQFDASINALVKSRDFEQAQMLAEKWTRQDSAQPKAWGKLAFVLKMQRRYDEATEAVRHAIELASFEPALWFDLGTIRYLAKDFGDAANAFSEAIRAGLQLNVSYYRDAAALSKSLCCLKADRLDEAQEALVGVAPDAQTWLDGRIVCGELRHHIEARVLETASIRQARGRGLGRSDI